VYAHDGVLEFLIADTATMKQMPKFVAKAFVIRLAPLAHRAIDHNNVH
jgi:hypothetical protein